MKIFEPYLAILMRSDLATMTGGRAAAQASHATSDFSEFFSQKNVMHSDAYETWKKVTRQHFGTAIVLGVNEKEMRDVANEAVIHEFNAEIINDPTYGVRDGSVTHYVSVDTCAWVFVHTNDSPFYDRLKTLPLF